MYFHMVFDSLVLQNMKFTWLVVGIHSLGPECMYFLMVFDSLGLQCMEFIMFFCGNL